MSETFLGPDDKTLRLATPEVTPQNLTHYVKYQQALLAGLKADVPAEWEAKSAQAHQHALELSGIDASVISRLRPVVADFCGRRWAVQELTRRRGELANDHDRIAKLDLELARLEDLSPLISRYGRTVVEVLCSLEGPLVQLHGALRSAE
jgi:hypothetical protein